MDTIKNQSLGTQRRMLGWDLWRIWGCFVIFLGHNYVLGFASLLDPTMIPATLGQGFYFPDVSQAFMYSAVPLFIMISGFFALGRPVKDNEWSLAKKNFVSYIIYYWRWLLLALVIFLVFPSVWPSRTPFADLTVGQSILMVLKNFVNTNLLQGGIIGPVALNWFIAGLALLML